MVRRFVSVDPIETPGELAEWVAKKIG